MALYSNNVLLGALGGPQYQQAQQDPTRQQIDTIRDYAKNALGAQLPTTMYSPWQGAGYLLDKFQGRNEADRANELQKSALLQALSGTAATPAPSPMTTGSVDQSQGQAQPAAQPQAAAPVAQPPIAAQMKPTIAPDTGAGQGNAALAGAAKLVIGPIDGHGPDSEVTPQQIAGGLPDGYKVKSIIGADGSAQPAPDTTQTAPAAPVAMPNPEPAPQQAASAPNPGAGGAPQGAAPIQTGSVNSPSHGGVTIGPPPMRKSLSPDVLKHIMALEPDDQKAVLDQYNESQKVQTQDTGFGTAWQTADGRRGFMPTPKVLPIEAFGTKASQIAQYDPETGKIGSQFLSPGGSSGSTFEDFARHSGEVQGQIDAKNAAAKDAATGGVKILQKPITDAIEAGDKASQLKAQVGGLQQIQNLPGGLNDLSTGPYAGQIMDAKKAINNIFPGTFDSEAIAKGETITKINTQIARMFARELTNRPTQFDFKTFIANTPGLENSPQGQKALSSLYMAMANQDEALGSIAHDYAGNPEGFSAAKLQFYKDHPISVQVNGKEYSFAYGKKPTIDGKEVDLSQPQPDAPKPSTKPVYDPQTGKWE